MIDSLTIISLVSFAVLLVVWIIVPDSKYRQVVAKKIDKK